MDSNVLTTDKSCTCAAPVPYVKAMRKGAARTYCARCELPVRISFESR